MSFWNCSKVLIDDLSDFSETYTGVNAKLFENCAESNSAQITFYEKTFVEASEETTWFWTVNPKSVSYCYGANTSNVENPAAFYY